MLQLSTDEKKYMSILQNKKAMCLVKYLTAAIPVGSPVHIKNPVPASQSRFPQFRVTEGFCVEGSNKRNDRGAL